MRKLLTILSISLCSLTYGQTTLSLGSYVPTVTNEVKGGLQVDSNFLLLKYANSDASKVLTVDETGLVGFTNKSDISSIVAGIKGDTITNITNIVDSSILFFPTYTTMAYNDYVYRFNALSDSGTLVITNTCNADSTRIISQKKFDTDGQVSFDIAGQYLYAACYSGDKLLVIDISNAADPQLVGTLYDATNLNGLYDCSVAGGYLFALKREGTNAVVSIDISDPTSPKYLSSVTGASLASSHFMDVHGSYAYVTTYNTAHFFNVIDISDPENMSITGSIEDTTNFDDCTDVMIQGRFAYSLSRAGNRLVIVDIADPANPEVFSSLYDPVNLPSPTRIVLSGVHAYISNLGAATPYITTVDISNPCTPTFVHGSSIPELFGTRSFDVKGNYLYGGGFGNASVNRVSDFAIPSIYAGSIQADKANLIELQANDIKTMNGVTAGGNLKTDKDLAVQGSIKAPGLDSLPTSNVLYYNNTTGAFTYGEASSTDVSGIRDTLGVVYDSVTATKALADDGNDIYVNGGGAFAESVNVTDQLVVRQDVNDYAPVLIDLRNGGSGTATGATIRWEFGQMIRATFQDGYTFFNKDSTEYVQMSADGFTTTEPIIFKTNAVDGDITFQADNGLGANLNFKSAGSILFTTYSGTSKVRYALGSNGTPYFYTLSNGNNNDSLLVTGSGGAVFRIPAPLSNTATLDFPSTSANGQSDLTMTVSGAAVGDAVSISIPNGSATNGTFVGWVSAADTVTIRFHNTNGVNDPASGVFKAVVFKW